MTDGDIPAPGRWREVVDFVRERGDSIFLRDVSSHFAIPSAYASRLFAQGVLGGKIHHQGPCKGLDCRQPARNIADTQNVVDTWLWPVARRDSHGPSWKAIPPPWGSVTHICHPGIAFARK